MLTPSGGLRRAWKLPIVLIICGLMVIPAAAILATPAAGGSGLAAHSSGASAVTASAGTNPKASPAAPATASHMTTGATTFQTPEATANQRTAATQTLQSALNTAEAKGANANSISLLQRLETGLADGSINPLALQLPNIGILLGEQAASSPKSQVGQYYTSTPAPMGLGDFGLGATTYELNTSAIEGSALLDSYNATGGSLYEDSGAYYWNGRAANSEGSPYDSGIQLNTVLANVTFPGSNLDPLGSGVFWTQNVPEFFGNNLTFLDNVWNFSAPGATMNPGTLYSYNGTLVPYDFYYDYGPTIPVSYPFWLQVYNNATVNAYGQDVLTYGYRAIDGYGTSSATVYTGIYDTIVFNSLGGGYTLTPQFRIDGYNYAPSGANFDAEIVFCGPAAGSNAVITNASGQMNLWYLNTSGAKPVWQAPTSAYDFGGDTGETSIGVAETWSGTTAYLSQGPSLMYGLWGTPSSVSVPSGKIAFSTGSTPMTPNYAFVFIGYYNSTETLSELPAYAPSSSAGTVSTWLPPSPPSAWTGYSLEAYADGYSNMSATFSGAQTSYAIKLTSSPKTLNAPLYMNGDAQETALLTQLTGSATGTLSDLRVSIDPYAGAFNATFNLVNDWGYPTFGLVYENGLTSPVSVNHVEQSWNWGNSSVYYTIYAYPYFGYEELNLSNASQQYIDYSSPGSTFSNLSLPCFFLPIGLCVGGAISLWGAADVTVDNVNSTDGSFGVWDSSSPDTTVENSVAWDDAAVFTVVASTGSIGTNLLSEYYSDAVYIMGGSGGTFTYINSTGYYGQADGAFAFWANTTSFSNVYASDDAYGIGLLGGTGDSVTNFWANDDAEAVETENTESAITISTGYATNYSAGVIPFDGSQGVTISGVSAGLWSIGVIDESNVAQSVSGTSATQWSVGVLQDTESGLAITGTSAASQSIGVLLYGDDAVVTDTTATNLSIAVFADDTTGASISGVTATNTTLSGLYSYAGLESEEYWTEWDLAFAAVVSVYNTALGVANITATTYPAAFFDAGSNGANVGDVNATGGWYGVVLNGTENSLLTDINTYQDYMGVVFQGGYDEGYYYTEYNTITLSRFVDDTSFAVYLSYYAEDNTVWNNAFIGNNGATSTYSAAHIQAYSYEPYNEFYWCANYDVCLSGVGNYWADWHTYGPNGYLAPYAITGGVYDEFPIGPQETFTVTFTESGLSSGTNWSVTFNGVTKNSTTSTIVFTATMGTYSYTLNGVQGYQLVSGSTGSVTLTGQAGAISVVYTSTQALATQSTVNGYFAIALALAIIALVLALIAFLMHRRKPGANAASNPPQAWTPPAGAGSGGAAGGSGGSPPSGASGSSSWSEGSGGSSGSASGGN